MKDQEVLDLCKQVYEATGWVVPSLKPFDSSGDPYTTHYINGVFQTYVYTSDYLLDKLPKELHRDGIIHLITVGAKYGDEFKANYVSASGYLYLFLEPEGNTPCEALLRLTLALDKEGLL